METMNTKRVLLTRLPDGELSTVRLIDGPRVYFETAYLPFHGAIAVLRTSMADEPEALAYHAELLWLGADEIRRMAAIEVAGANDAGT